MAEPNWKELALWLADCQCATAWRDLERKATSKIERKRQLSICATALSELRHGSSTMRPSKQESVERRLSQLLDTFIVSEEGK